MGRLTATTRKVVENYYGEIKRIKNEELAKIQEKCIKSKVEEFEKDKRVKEVRNLLEILNKEYNIDLEIHLPRYMVKYNTDENYINKIKEIKEINNEKDILLVILDTYSKTSDKYKNALNKLNEIIGE